MNVTVLFLLLGLALCVFWALARQLTEKPWLNEGLPALPEGPPRPTLMIGLGSFMAVVASLFVLIASAYFIRMELADWRPAPIPPVLWLNTLVLIGASIAFQQAKASARRGSPGGLRFALLTAGTLSLAFIVGQFVAWNQLAGLGFGLSLTPAGDFFYLITALHALHLLGGLVVWARTTLRLLRGSEVARLLLGVEACTVYWHFLLLVWLALFGLLLTT